MTRGSKHYSGELEKTSNVSQSARCRALIHQAERLLQQRRTEFKQACEMRKHLLAKLDLLKALEGDAIVVPPSSISDRSISVDEDTSPGGSLLHELALRAVTARMSWSPRDCPPILSLSSNLIHFDSLPLTLDGYTEDVVIRTAEMLVGDEVHVFKGFLNRANDKVIHVENHGTHSPMYNDLKEEIQRYSNWLMLRTLIRTRDQDRVLHTNFITGEDEEAPEGWYRRIANGIPVNTNLAGTIRCGMAYLQHAAKGELLNHHWTANQVLAALPPLPAGDETATSSGHIMDGPRLHKLEALLNAFDRYTRSVRSRRNLMAVHLPSRLVQLMQPEVTARILCSSWPYCPRPLSILHEYIQRGDVLTEMGVQPCSPSSGSGASATGLPNGSSWILKHESSGKGGTPAQVGSGGGGEEEGDAFTCGSGDTGAVESEETGEGAEGPSGLSLGGGIRASVADVGRGGEDGSFGTASAASDPIVGPRGISCRGLGTKTLSETALVSDGLQGGGGGRVSRTRPAPGRSNRKSLMGGIPGPQLYGGSASADFGGLLSLPAGENHLRGLMSGLLPDGGSGTFPGLFPDGTSGGGLLGQGGPGPASRGASEKTWILPLSSSEIKQEPLGCLWNQMVSQGGGYDNIRPLHQPRGQNATLSESIGSLGHQPWGTTAHGGHIGDFGGPGAALQRGAYVGLGAAQKIRGVEGRDPSAVDVRALYSKVKREVDSVSPLLVCGPVASEPNNLAAGAGSMSGAEQRNGFDGDMAYMLDSALGSAWGPEADRI